MAFGSIILKTIIKVSNLLDRRRHVANLDTFLDKTSTTIWGKEVEAAERVATKRKKM